MKSYFRPVIEDSSGSSEIVRRPDDCTFYVVNSSGGLDAIAALYGYRLGTGGVDEALLLRIAGFHRSHPTTSSAVYESHIVERDPRSEPLSSRVNSIRSIFGLSVTDLAGALRVERPTVYSWLKDKAIPNPVSMQRIDALERLAETWARAAGGNHKPDLRAVTQFGPVLLDALREDGLREFMLKNHLETVGRIVRDRSTAIDFAAIARSAGIRERPSIDFDVDTGRPLSKEQ